MVFLRHAVYLGGYPSAGTPLDRLMLNGWIGVDLFFVLSGFLISRPFFGPRRQRWRPYLLRRALRILPAYWVALGLSAAGMFPLHPVAAAELPRRLVQHLLFLQDYTPADIVVAFWSLGVEEKFYLLVPLLIPLVVALRSSGLQYSALLGVLLVGPASRALTWFAGGAPADYDDFFTLFRSPFHVCIDGLFLGVLLAKLERARSERIRPGGARLSFYAGAVALLVLTAGTELLHDLGFAAVVLRPLLLAVIFAAMVGGAIFGGAPRLFARALPRALGRVSYSLYLVHVPLVPAALLLARQATGSAADRLPAFAVFLAVYAALTLAVTALLYLGVERPFLRLKSRLSGRAQAEAAAATEAAGLSLARPAPSQKRASSGLA
jgi:peptidoglycan/LPS O-acetylase OafA/YrhL